MSPMPVRFVAVVALLTVPACVEPKAAPPDTPSPAAAPTAVPAPAVPAPAEMHFTGVDLFGTSRLTVEELLAPLHDRFAEYERLSVADRYEEAAPIQHELEGAVKRAGAFAFVKFSLIRYFGPGDPRYVTIDVVEPGDVARRMNFAKPPDAVPLGDPANLLGPDGLLAKYAEYERKGFELLGRHEKIDDPAAATELFHCPFGFAHPQLAPYEAPLVEGARTHADELFTVVHRDRDPQHRAHAIFLLGFTSDGARLVREITPACRDENSMVRNNAMRVFAEMAHHHPEVELPLAPVLEMLEYPETTDRNKAAAVLAALAKKPELAPEIRRRGGKTLVAMLRLKQPNNHDWAFQILNALVDENTRPFASDDYEGWEGWLDDQD